MENELTGREQFESVKAILRDRQTWLQGELDPPNRKLHDIQELIFIRLEIRLLNDLFDVWESNPY
jgi:hypothetical protein